jgi:hypothetical protein
MIRFVVEAIIKLADGNIQSGSQGNLTESIEVSCASGHLSHDRDMLKTVSEHQITKCANEGGGWKLPRVSRVGILVLSVGAVDTPSLKDLETILGYDKRDA